MLWRAKKFFVANPIIFTDMTQFTFVIKRKFLACLQINYQQKIFMKDIINSFIVTTLPSKFHDNKRIDYKKDGFDCKLRRCSKGHPDQSQYNRKTENFLTQVLC